MKSFCQFILPVLLLIPGGCAWFASSSPDDAQLLSRIEPVWFNMGHGIRLANWQGETQPHLFYDATPELNASLSHVNFLPLSVAGQEAAYELDILSGQRYFSYFQCGQADVWRERSSVSGKTLYTMGVVPRHLDQMNRPQRIIVFGGADRFEVNQPITYRSRIVGALVEQSCPVGKCSGPKDWVGRLILVGVDERDRTYGKVKNIKQLQEVVSFDNVRAQLENLPGRNRFADRDYPAIRVGNLLDARDAVEFMLKRSVVFTAKELVGLQKSCGKAYDIMWEEAGKEHFLDKPAKTKEEIRKHSELVKKLKLAGKATYFPQRLAWVLEKYGDELATCGRLVYAGDPNGNADKFRFNSWVLMFVRLHKAGWEYECRTKSWIPSNRGAEAMTNMKRYSLSCTAKEFDYAMAMMPAFLKTLRHAVGENWRFIAWDEHVHGTHAKLQTWVNVPDKQFACDGDMNAKVRESWKEKPEGFDWVNRHSDKQLRDSDYIY